MMYRIMTFNIKNDFMTIHRNMRWETRKQSVLSMLAHHDADVIGIQEMTQEIRIQLEKALPQYTFVGDYRYKNKDHIFNESVTILLKKARFKIINHRTLWLSGTPQEVGSRSTFSIFPRICTLAHIQDKTNLQHLLIANTHLDHMFDRNRMMEVKVIVEEVRMYLHQHPIPTVVMGDLNAKMGSQPIQYLQDRSLHPFPLVSAYFPNQPLSNTYHGTSGKAKENHSPIDYIFVTNDVHVYDVTIISEMFEEIYPSDHFPVIAKIGIAQSH